MITKEKKFISVVLYVHNCENIIYDTLTSLNKFFEENFDIFEIICVNDSSYDKSKMMIQKYVKESGNSITLVNMSVFQGIDLSMTSGVDIAIGDFVFEFDNPLIDFSNDLIMEVYKSAFRGFDIVCASKNISNKVSSKLFYKIFNKYSNNKYDVNSDTFRVLSRRAINRISSMSQTIPYRKAIYVSSGLNMNFISYESKLNNVHQFTKETKEIRYSVAADSLILFTDLAQKISISISFLFFIFTSIAFIYTVSIFLGANKPVEGWTTTMIVLSSGLTGIFLMLTIIIKYLTLIIDLIFKKHRYLIQSIEKISKD